MSPSRVASIQWDRYIQAQPGFFRASVLGALYVSASPGKLNWSHERSNHSGLGCWGTDLSSLQTGAALGSSLACPDAVRASLSPQRLLRSSLSWHVPLGEVHLWSVFDYTRCLHNP